MRWLNSQLSTVLISAVIREVKHTFFKLFLVHYKEDGIQSFSLMFEAQELRRVRCTITMYIIQNKSLLCAGFSIKLRIKMGVLVQGKNIPL